MSRFGQFPIRCCAALLLCLTPVATLSSVAAAEDARWYKGNTHAHTLWSDGNDFPEMVASWYKAHGYDFLGISDHNSIMAGDAWRPIDEGKRSVPSALLEKCQKQFGPEWLEIRTKNNQREVKIKTFQQLNAKLGEPDKFLLIPNEELTTGFDGHAVHLCALNLAEFIKPNVGQSVAETISLNVALGKEQAERLSRPILVHTNHPNFAEYDITPEDLAASTTQFFEVCNGHPGVRNLGDATHPSCEKAWDIANTIRIAKMNAAPLLAVGSDDAHQYDKFTAGMANPARAWIVVRANKLTPEALIDAMNRADFYASSGVVLRNVAYDAKQRTVTVEIEPETGVSYAIEFVGTLKGVDPAGQPVESPNQNPKRPGRTYSPEVGKVLSRVEGTSATYKLTGDELYVRPVVRSNKPIANASAGGGKLQEAWCQPVGWQK